MDEVKKIFILNQDCVLIYSAVKFICILNINVHNIFIIQVLKIN